MSDSKIRVHKTFIELDSDKADQTRDAIKSNKLKPIAEAFSASLDNIIFLLVTPQILLSHGYGQATSFSYFSSLANIDKLKGYSNFEEWYSMVEDKVKEVSNTKEARDKFIAYQKNYADEELSKLMKDKWVGSSIHFIYASALVNGWTAFECLAADSWEAAVNERPIQLGHSAFEGIPKNTNPSPNLSSKSVSVGLLAKFGFDLTSSLGTVLKKKYDFTSITGIKQAFLNAFGKNQALENVFNDNNLSNLEAVRHLIVHRLGIIDEEYMRRMNLKSGKGKRISLKNSLMSELLGSVVESGSNLLMAVDRSLCGQSKS